MAHGRWPTEDPDHEYVENRVRYWTRRLAAFHGLSAEECEDAAQDLCFDLLRRLKAFDPRRASRRTFIARIVEHGYCTLLEERYAAMRDPHKHAYSLDAPANDEQSDEPTRLDAIGQDQYDAALGRHSSAEEKRDLEISISAQIRRMPAPLKEVCTLMYKGYRASEVARLQGIHRSTFYGRRAELRRRLKDAGFETP